MLVNDVFNPVQLGVTVRVVGSLPRLGPLEWDHVYRQQLTDPFPTNGDDAGLVVIEIVGELADTPPGEHQPQLHRASRGRIDNECDAVSRDQAGTAARPLRVQRLHPHIVEPVDHLPDPVRGGLHQPGDHPNIVP